MKEKEFYSFVEDTKRVVLSAVRKYLAKEYYHSIDDVVQETYIRAYKGMKKTGFTDEKSLYNWLFTIAKNEAIRTMERLNREEIKIKKIKESISAKPGYFLDKFDEEIMEMRDIISTLPEKYKIIFELLVLGFSESQIAEKLSLKRGTIKSRIHRGKEIIHRTSKGGCINYEVQ